MLMESKLEAIVPVPVGHIKCIINDRYKTHRIFNLLISIVYTNLTGRIEVMRRVSSSRDVSSGTPT